MLAGRFLGAEECPGISDEDVAALCSESQRVLLTCDKDFGELVFRGGLSAGSGACCFGLFPGLPKKWRTRPWHGSSLSPISAGLFALSHESGFESGQCSWPRKPDHWYHGTHPLDVFEPGDQA